MDIDKLVVAVYDLGFATYAYNPAPYETEFYIRLAIKNLINSKHLIVVLGISTEEEYENKLSYLQTYGTVNNTFYVLLEEYINIQKCNEIL